MHSPFSLFTLKTHRKIYFVDIFTTICAILHHIGASMINHNQSINALFFWCREAFENAHCESVLHIGWIDRFEFGRMRSDSVCCQFGWWFWCYGFFFCQRSANHRWIDRITCGCVLHCKSFCCWPQLLQHCKKTFLRWSKKKMGSILKPLTISTWNWDSWVNTCETKVCWFEKTLQSGPEQKPKQKWSKAKWTKLNLSQTVRIVTRLPNPYGWHENPKRLFCN